MGQNKIEAIFVEIKTIKTSRPLLYRNNSPAPEIFVHIIHGQYKSENHGVRLAYAVCRFLRYLGCAKRL